MKKHLESKNAKKEFEKKLDCPKILGAFLQFWPFLTENIVKTNQDFDMQSFASSLYAICMISLCNILSQSG